MPPKFHQLPVKLPVPTLHMLIDLQRVRGPSLSPEVMAHDPVRKGDIPSKAAVIRSLIEEAHRREIQNG